MPPGPRLPRGPGGPAGAGRPSSKIGGSTIAKCINGELYYSADGEEFRPGPSPYPWLKCTSE